MEYRKSTTFKREPNRRSRSGTRDVSVTGRFTDNADWAVVPAEEVADFVSRIVAAGACCVFSRATDGGVLSLTVIYGGERWRSFPRSADDAIVAMRDIMDDLDA